MDHEAWSDAQVEATVTVDGRERSVAYYDGGDEGDPPVVFLHGIPTWSFLWREVAAALEDEHRVVAPDLLGYGNSEMTDAFDRSIRAQEAMLGGLLDDLGIDGASDLALVGHDIGGSVALRYAWHEPDVVEKLVLSNAGCYDSWPVEFINGIGLPGAVTGMDDEEFEETMGFVFENGLYGDSVAHDEFAAGMRAPWDSTAGRTSLERCAVATNTNHTTEIDYAAIAAETLLLWGADDVLQSIDYAERLAEDISGPTEVVPLAEAYHWVVEDRPEAYADHLAEFLG